MAMIQHIFKIIGNQWKKNIWILAELLIVFILLWACCAVLYSTAERYSIPLGFDTDHVYRVAVRNIPPSSPYYTKDRSDGKDFLDLAERLRKCPAIEAVSVSYYAHLYAGYSNYTNLYNDSISVYAKYGQVSPEFVDVFRIKALNENIDLKERLKDGYVILSSDAAEKLFGEERTLGEFTNSTDSNAQVLKGVITGPMKRSPYYYGLPMAFFPFEKDYYENRSYAGFNDEICIRVFPKEDHNFPSRFFEMMEGQLAIGNLYITELISFDTMAERYHTKEGITDTLYQTIFITVFFMLNILLGIVGTFWFRTQSRRSEIGVRSAMGATRASIRKMMFLEGICMLLIVWVPAILLCYHLLYSGALESLLVFKDVNFIYYLKVTLITTALVSLMIVAGIWYPARQASRLKPVDALHYE